MAVQPALPPMRRPLPRRVDTRRRRLDPPNAFQTSQPFTREPEKPDWIESADPALPTLPGVPLVGAPMVPARTVSRRWMATLAASVALHLAVAAFFITRGNEDQVLVAGSDEAGILMLGSAPEDQTSAGEMVDEATNVMIVTMLDAKPVETVDATEVATSETLEPVTETLAEAVTEDRLEPVVEERVEPTPSQPAAPVQPERISEALPEATQPVVENVPAQASLAELLPEILATDTPEVVADDLTVAPAAPVTAVQQTPPEEVVPEAATTAPTETVVAETLTPAVSETLEPALEPPVVAEAPKPVEPEKKPEPKKPEPKKAEARKPAEKPAKAAPTPANKAETKKTAGAGGTNKINAKKGKVDGEAEGTRTDAAGKGKSTTAGNADVTNYPGKVVSKLKRQLGRVPMSARRSARQDVHVSFTVTTSGGLAGVSIARSSGSPALDKAALEVVRRAAPFPPIPDGRKSWRFSFPLGLK